MFKRSSISKVIDYYTQHPDYKDECNRAIEDFFDVADIAMFDPSVVTPMEEGLLNEWLVFDFLLLNGDTLLQRFIAENPLQLSADDIEYYRQIERTKRYSLFEILSVQRDQGMRLRDTVTGKTYTVREKTATQQAEKGYLIPQRVARIDGVWYLVGADSVVIPMRLDDRMRDLFAANPSDITPKETRVLVSADDGEAPIALGTAHAVALDRSEVEKRAAGLLHEFGLAEMVNVQDIQRWIGIEYEGEPLFSWIVNVIVGLIDKNRFAPSDIGPLMQAVLDLWNVSPHPALGGKSPQEMAGADTHEKPDWHETTTDIGGHEWMVYQYAAVACMDDGDYAAAIKEFRNAFDWLLKNRSTDREIYRLFGNAAIAHVNALDIDGGVLLLKYALELNPNYDFALDVMEQVPVDYKKKRKRKNPLAHHPAYAYMQWLRELGIRFATPEPTTTPLRTIGGERPKKRAKKRRSRA